MHIPKHITDIQTSIGILYIFQSTRDRLRINTSVAEPIFGTVNTNAGTSWRPMCCFFGHHTERFATE